MTYEELREQLAYLEGYVHIGIGEPVKLLDVEEEEEEEGTDSTSADNDDLLLPF